MHEIEVEQHAACSFEAVKPAHNFWHERIITLLGGESCVNFCTNQHFAGTYDQTGAQSSTA